VSGADADGVSAEDRLIAKHFAPMARHPGALGLMDDCAFYAPPQGHELVLKADAIVGSVHFFPDDPPDLVAKKALRVNLSDLAAKGAEPAGFLLSLALPRDIGEAWLEAFARGLKEDAEAFACPLFGGDTVRSPGPIMVSVATFGTVPAGRMVRRGGAKVGDAVMVTGTIGDAVLGLRVRQWEVSPSLDLDEAASEELVGRYLLPRPRNPLAEALRDNAHGGMDVSDGLVGDLAKLCRAAGVSAEIDVGRIPLSRPAQAFLRDDPGLLQPMLTGGDDYEVLFTLPPGRVAAMREAAAAAGVPVAEIGRIVADNSPPRFVAEDGKVLQFAQTAFSHF
jgi:thiamine-monophosphate kinase